MQDFAGKSIFVTGGASGLGFATCKLLASRGASLAIVDIRLEPAQQSAAAISEEFGVRAIGLQADVSKGDQVARAVEEAVKQLGSIHGALNSAGVPGNKGAGASLADYPEDDWRLVMDVNSSGVFYSTKHEIKAMLKNPGPARGSIVNISSLAGHRALGPHVAYIASKHAVIGITKAAALEYGGHESELTPCCPASLRPTCLPA